jgi:hypothetical protein
MMKKIVTVCGAMLLLATTSAYADAGEKLLCTRNNDREWVHVILNLTKNIAWDDYAPGVAHDGPNRRFALTVVSGMPLNKNLGVSTVTWGNAVLVDADLTEGAAGSVKFQCHNGSSGYYPGDEPHP